ncbi:pseudouridine kinase isoform X2 [Andrographis paniculata]|uniref:pseudouridine kinase isoform X2 n=1 Tax=Andrographis paniculata TaxID=175694 RepID=UPI0021E9A1C3|nr:pseudouridine kinase isoform X2 [Andrographis paniculata]
MESRDEAAVVVIGGMVLDVNATASSMAANPRTTVPGKVLYMLGGVGRNVAECMSKLGEKPFMISVVGYDLAGSFLLESWKYAGLSDEGIQRKQDIDTGVVCNVFDGKGELAAGIASAEAIEKFLTPQWIGNFKSKICSAPMLMLDANLSDSALLASCQLAVECRTPVWFEPVSVTKSKRIASIVRHVTFTSPNEDELIAMANVLSPGDKFSPIPRDNDTANLSIGSLFQMLKPAIWVLLHSGVRIVVATLGSHGVFLCFEATYGAKRHDHTRKASSSFSTKLYDSINLCCVSNSILSSRKTNRRSSYIAIHFPALPASVARLTGAGDCLVGATIASYCAGLDIMQSVAVGIAAAKGAVESELNVPADYELTKISDDAASVYSNAKVVFCESKL